jgi:hypothetical protein
MCRNLNCRNMIFLNTPCYRDTKYKGHVTVTMSNIEEDLCTGDYNVNNIDNKASQTRWEVPVYKSVSK